MPPPEIVNEFLALLKHSRTVAVEMAERMALPLTERVELLAVRFPEPDSDDWRMGEETVTRSCMANSQLSASLLENVADATAEERVAVAKAMSDEYGEAAFIGPPWQVERYACEPLGWIESRLIEPLVSRYLRVLPRLTEPDSALASSFISDVLHVVETHRFQVVASAILGGFLAPDVVKVGDVSLRPLDPFEIGEIIAPFTAHRPRNDLNAVQLSLAFWVPRHILEVEIEADMEDLRVGCRGAGLRELLLGLQLLGFDPTGVGTYREAPRAPWLFGVRGGPLLVQLGPVSPRNITAADLKEAISLTKAFPKGALDPPTSTRTFSMHRFALGCSRSSVVDSVVDFVVSMEAALLRGEQGEPTFRFAANGAAFTRGPGPGRRAAYDELRKLYNIRSRAVHGGSFPTPGELQAASVSSRNFAREVLIRAVREGWPTPDTLAESLMGTQTGG